MGYKVDPVMKTQAAWKHQYEQIRDQGPFLHASVCPSEDASDENPVNEGWRRRFAKVNSAIVHLQPHVRKHKHGCLQTAENPLREQQRSSNTAAG